MPSIPPTIAKDVFSVINCRSSRHRVAPSAARSVIPRSRAVPRISSKFATLKEPVTKRRTAAATNRVSTGLTSPTIASLNGMVTLRTSRGEPFGAIGPSCRTRVPDSSATWATVALACTRATRLNQPSFSVSGAMSSGRQTSASPGNVTPCGATPATVAGRPLSRSVRPTICGVTTELPAPEAVCDDRHRLRASDRILLAQQSADGRPHPEYVEEVPGHRGARDRDRSLAELCGHRPGAVVLNSTYRFERPARLAPCGNLCVRKGDERRARRQALGDEHQSRSVCNR